MRARARIERAGEDAAGAGVGVDQLGERPAGVVAAVVGFRGQHADDAERILGRPAQLVAQDGSHLRRPEKLVLEVHQPPGRAQCPPDTPPGSRTPPAARGGRSARERCGRSGPRAAPRGRPGPPGRGRSPVTLVPAHREVGGDVGNRRSLEAAAMSCQPTAARSGCALVSQRSPASRVRSMPPTNATRSSITIVFSWWQCSGRSRASRTHWIPVPSVRARAHPPDGAPRRAEDRHRRPGPGDHPHVGPFGDLGKQVAQDDRLRDLAPARTPARRTSRRCARASGPPGSRPPSAAAPAHRRSAPRARSRPVLPGRRQPIRPNRHRAPDPSRRVADAADDATSRRGRPPRRRPDRG